MVNGKAHLIRFGFIMGIGLSTFAPSTESQPTPVSLHGQLKIKGNRFVDKYDTPVTLHGMSMYNWALNGTKFYNTTAINRLVQEWKCTAIRCVLLPGNAAKQTNLVDTVIKACVANGIYVIVNWHSMGGANADECAKWMADIAGRWGNMPNIMYEPWNEPVTETWPALKIYHEKVIASIRAIDPDNIIILGNPSWDQRPDLAAANRVTTSTNLAYSFHFYAGSHKIASMGKNVRIALDSGIAIFCTEYGTCAANGSGGMDTAETRKWWKYLDSNGIGSTNWSVSALGETSAAFNNGTSELRWTDADIKPSGQFVKNYIMSRYASTVSENVSTSYLYARRGLPSLELTFAIDPSLGKMFTLNGARVTGFGNGRSATRLYILKVPVIP
jgi:endoglucanase